VTVFVVLEHQGQATRLVGVYATGEIAGQAAPSTGWSAEVVPCDVLDQAP
jgi:hypothetical protein